MFTKISFTNFRSLECADLPLGPVTVIVGPNGSGKSTAFLGLKFAVTQTNFNPETLISVKSSNVENAIIKVLIESKNERNVVKAMRQAKKVHGEWKSSWEIDSGLKQATERVRFLDLRDSEIGKPVPLKVHSQLNDNGSGLAAFLDSMRDQYPERFEMLNRELTEWFPEFDRVIFSVPNDGQRAIGLRQKISQCVIPAESLSSGTLIALTFLALVYDPEPPALIAIEEPDRGIHPRLLRRLQDAIYRLAYPKTGREPVQVICTTHSPYFLDLFSEHPEEIVVAEKTEQGTKFTRLSEKPDIFKILDGAPLGEIWYSGILGGVPTES